MQIEVRKSQDKNSWFVYHTCKSNAEYSFLTKSLEEIPDHRKSLDPNGLIVTVLVLDTKE